MPALLHELLWFLPWCWFMNMSHNVPWFLVRRFPKLSRYERPIDRGRIFMDGRRVLGDSTTFGGLVLTVALGGIGEWLGPGHHFFLLALLVYLGHMLGSFLKRRFSVPSGAYVPLLDHGDYIYIAGAGAYVLGSISAPAWIIAWLATLALTPLVTHLGFRFGLRARRL